MPVAVYQAVGSAGKSRTKLRRASESSLTTPGLDLATRLRVFQRALRSRVEQRDALIDIVRAVNATLEPPEIQDCLNGHPQSWPQSLVSRTLAQGNPGQDNVTVVSITLDSGTLGEWVPEPPPSIFHAPAEPVPAVKASPGKTWLIAAVILLLIAAAFAGLWYFSGR